MAAAITYNRQEDASVRERKNKSSFILVGSLTLTGTYSTDGEAMDLSGIFKDLQMVMFETKAGYSFEYDYTAKKVKVFRVGELAHTTVDLTALTDHDDNPTYHAVHAAGALAEVADQTDITAASGVKFVAIGF